MSHNPTRPWTPYDWRKSRILGSVSNELKLDTEVNETLIFQKENPDTKSILRLGYDGWEDEIRFEWNWNYSTKRWVRRKWWKNYLVDTFEWQGWSSRNVFTNLQIRSYCIVCCHLLRSSHSSTGDHPHFTHQWVRSFTEIFHWTTELRLLFVILIKHILWSFIKTS